MSTTLAIALFAFVLVATPTPCSAGYQPDFDLFYFVQQWPGSFCANGTCCYPDSGKPPAVFYIHALSPALSDGTRLESCTSNSFNASNIGSKVTAELHASWPSLACPPNDTAYWSQEWSKHGTCSGFTHRNYFLAAYNLYQQLDLLSALQANGLKIGGSYHPLRIRNAIASVLNHTVVLECTNDSYGKPLLFQVYACADKNATTFIDCPAPPNGITPCPKAALGLPPFSATA